MRIIKSVDIVTAQGVKSYEVGKIVNGLKIVRFEYYSDGDSYECVEGWDFTGKNVVRIAQCPMVIEYADGGESQ